MTTFKVYAIIDAPDENAAAIKLLDMIDNECPPDGPWPYDFLKVEKVN